ncbi:MAG: hypothetical protein WC438_04845 [Candidatus Pacearchaeota archaeon]
MATKNIKQELEGLVESHKTEIISMNQSLILETYKDILDKTRKNANKGLRNLFYSLMNPNPLSLANPSSFIPLKNPNEYSEKMLVDAFGEELCRMLNEKGLNAKYEYKPRYINGERIWDEDSANMEVVW